MDRLAIRKLTVGYEQLDRRVLPVVFDVSLELRAGTVTGLVGESGCGKSTLAMAAAGYVPAGAHVLGGEVLLDGVSIVTSKGSSANNLWGRTMTYIAQNAGTSLNPSLKVQTQVVQVLWRHFGIRGAPAKARAVDLLVEAGLPAPDAALANYPWQFSGGQQQRIALAVALAGRPSVLILDEPTAGLDTATQVMVARLIRKLTDQRQLAVLFVTHDVALLSTVADTLHVMYSGQLVEGGPARELLQAPSHPYTYSLLRSVPDARSDAMVVGIPGRPPMYSVTNQCPYYERCFQSMEACKVGRISWRSVTATHHVACIAPLPAAERPPASSRNGTHGSSESLLRAAQLNCSYPSRGLVVHDVSFEVAAGRILAIVGQTGSGKSTLLWTIAGLHRHATGSLSLDGSPLAIPISRRPWTARSSIQMVFQDPDSSLNPRHTILDIVRRPIRLFRRGLTTADQEAEVRSLLHQVQLSDEILYRYPHELSGGQRQRIALARAFGARPRLLLCDEVTSALDVSVQAGIVETLVRLVRQTHTALVFVSHDLALVRSFADSTMVMDEGRVCEIGPTPVIFGNPQSDSTRRLLNALPRLPDFLPAKAISG